MRHLGLPVALPTAAEVRNLRVSTGYSQQAWSMRLGVSLRTWSRWENVDQLMPSAAWELMQLIAAELPPPEPITYDEEDEP